MEAFNRSKNPETADSPLFENMKVEGIDSQVKISGHYCLRLKLRDVQNECFNLDYQVCKAASPTSTKLLRSFLDPIENLKAKYMAVLENEFTNKP